MKLLWLMLAGALGTAARYGLTLVIQAWLAGRGSRTLAAAWLGVQFPLGTLVINVLGALLLSFVVTLVAQETVRPELRLIIGTGFLGAFTTFSTFELESEYLLSHGNWLPATVYIGGNLVLGFLAIFAGRALALRVVG
jgi:CrcB protein